MILVVLGVSAPKATADSGLVCVQNQMIALGYDVGKPDGIFGPLLKTAFTRMQAKRGEKAFQFNLKDGRYLVLCRALGIEQPELQQFWPVGDRSFNLSSDGTLVEEQQSAIQSLARSVLPSLGQDMQVVLADRVELVAGTNPAVVQVLAKAALGRDFNRDNFAKNYDYACSDAVLPGGFAVFNVVVLCLDPEDITPDARSIAVLRSDLAKALFHSTQNQLLGYPDKGSEAQLLARMGPAWLLDGSAAYVALQTAEPPLTVGLAAGAQPPDLAAMELRPQDEAARHAVETAGLLAVSLLMTGKAEKNLAEFYEKLGEGQAWTDAFETCFDEPVQAFYARFAAQ